ncbi:MAG: RecQ family ATP-dependent DNA helicase [Aurantibacter sp.]
MQKHPKDILKQYWGYDNFKGSQEKIVSAILQEKDVLALLPTGGGKSLCFQLPTLIQEGVCIVVSPLISLIQNQVEDLKQKGVKAVALIGGITQNELIDLLDNCLYGNYKFLYLSPERLKQELVINKIREMNVSLIAIDEAHCISQWGHDFRPAYLECDKLRAALPDTPVIALTATATEQVAKDIIGNLKFIDPLIVRDSFSRENIAFDVIRTEDKRYCLLQLSAATDNSIIVYVRTRRLTVEIAQYLNSKDIKADFFHGGLDKHQKKKKLDNWLQNKVKVMVATNAFGMGIDKADVSLVLHFQIPDCLENYFQEAGRAGRDGKSTKAVLLTNNSDEALLSTQFLSVLPDTPFLKMVYNKLNNYFQISYGELVVEPFQFNLYTFCDTYKLNTLIAYNAFRILDQNSVISLSESFSRKSELKFISTKNILVEYLEKNPGVTPITQTILRTYGGVFDFETKINTHLISKKTGQSEARVIKALEQLHNDGIIEYKAYNNDLEVTFLVPREDDITINAFIKKVEELHKTKVEKLDAMLAYVSNETICRSRLLLSYFGEQKSPDCGKCDICAKDRKQESTFDIHQRIIELLKENNKSSRALIKELGLSNAQVITELQNLLEDGFIKINTKNEYELSQ